MTPEVKNRIAQIRRGEVPEGYKRGKIGIFPLDWEETQLKKLFVRQNRRNAINNTNVLTISAQYGLISQEKFFNKDIASEDKSNYYLLERGDFAYNKSYSNGYPFGAIKSLKKYEKGIVSPLYICFTPSEKNKCPDYYEHYFESGLLNHEIQAIAQEGARNHGLLNIAVGDFFNSLIVAPPAAEQQKIASILSAQDKIIDLKERLLEEKKQQKKYLMQQLLTGRKRLPGFSGNWNTVELDEVFEYQQPTRFIVKSTDYSDKYSTPVLTAGKTFILGYTNETADIYKDVPAIIFDDFTTASQYVDFPFKVKSSAMKILKIKSGYNIIFAYGAMQMINYVVAGHERNWISKYSKLTVEMPCLAEQTAIAEVLSTADREIELLEQSIKAEKQKKKALMQLLLTGIVRVKI